VRLQDDDHLDGFQFRDLAGQLGQGGGLEHGMAPNAAVLAGGEGRRLPAVACGGEPPAMSFPLR